MTTKIDSKIVGYSVVKEKTEGEPSGCQGDCSSPPTEPHKRPEVIAGKTYKITETHCMAKGDPHCRFEIGEALE